MPEAERPAATATAERPPALRRLRTRLGLTLAAVGVGPAVLVAGPGIGLVLALTVVAVCTLATTVGSSVPLLAKRVGIDPAIVSAPFISTFVDTTGLVVYFSIAKAVLGI